MRPHRVCAVCGKDLYRKKVWEQRKGKVIGYCCAPEWGFWPDGSLYSKVTGPTEAQKAQLKHAN